MAESHKCNFEQKKSDIKEYILHASIYIKQESKLIIYIRSDYPWWWGEGQWLVTGRELWRAFGRLVMSCCLIGLRLHMCLLCENSSGYTFMVYAIFCIDIISKSKENGY